jgi:hypothetical protein
LRIAGALLAALAAGLACVPGSARAGAFYAKDEALALAFPDATAVEAKTVFLTEEQAATIRARTGTRPESMLFTYYVGRREGELLGYAVIDTHTVRTLPETFLAVLSPGGEVQQVILLAFYEPPEYKPSERWLAQFAGRSLGGSDWRVGRDIHGITGATLTARAIPQALQKVLLLHEMVMQPQSRARTAP